MEKSAAGDHRISLQQARTKQGPQQPLCKPVTKPDIRCVWLCTLPAVPYHLAQVCVCNSAMQQLCFRGAVLDETSGVRLPECHSIFNFVLLF